MDDLIEIMASAAYEDARRHYAPNSPPWDRAYVDARVAVKREMRAALDALADAGFSVVTAAIRETDHADR
jgi:hypothetical protein